MIAFTKKNYLLSIFLTSFLTPALADSESMRKKESVSVNLHLGNDSPGNAGVGIAYSFGSRFELALQAFKGDSDLKANFREMVELPTGLTLSTADLNTQIVKLVTRFLPGNSFSLLFAAGYRQDKINYAFVDSDLRWDFSAVLSRETIIASAGFGNQWTFDNGVNFGIDWAIFSWPVAKRSNTSLSSRGLSTEQAEILDRSIQFWTSDLVKSIPDLSMMYTIGFRF